jgi:anti-sigma factor RsiW
MNVAGCAVFRAEIEAYLDDRLEGERRTAFRGHLGTCPACRAELEGRDGSMLFARLADLPEGAGFRGGSAEGAEFLAAVRRGIAIEQTRRRAAPRRVDPRWYRLAAAIGIVGLVGILAFVSRPSSAPAPSGPTSVAAAPMAPRASVALARASAPIEDLDRRDARIYHLDAGGSDDDPQVVLIVDRGMDI